MTDSRTAESEFRPLGISTRAINALAANGVYTRRELGRVTERDLSRMPGIGPAALKLLRPYLLQEGPSVELHVRPRVVSVEFPAKSLTMIDAWAVEQAAPSRAEALRRLVKLGLKAGKRRK